MGSLGDWKNLKTRWLGWRQAYSALVSEAREWILSPTSDDFKGWVGGGGVGGGGVGGAGGGGGGDAVPDATPLNPPLYSHTFYQLKYFA